MAKLLAIYENEEYYQIPYDDISGYGISKSGKIISNKSGEWEKHKVTIDKRSHYHIVTLTTNDKTSPYLHRNVKQSTFTLHKLLYSTFVSGRNHTFNEVIDHINNNRSDNRLENLRLISRCENTQKSASERGLKVMTKETVKSLYDEYKAGTKRKVLLAKYQISQYCFRNIISGYYHNDVTGLPKKYYYKKKKQDN